MLEHDRIAAATRIGMLTRERDTTAACGAALSVLAGALPVDAATLVGVDPRTGRHFQVAGIGYAAEVSDRLAAQFIHTPWYRSVLTEPLPPSISDDPGQSFRRGWFYEQYTQPAGYRDGVTGALRHGDRYVGMVHLSSERAGAFDTQARHLLAAVLPALAALADLTGRIADDLPPGAAAALVLPDGVVELPDRQRPPVLDDGAFLGLLAEFTAAGGYRLRLLWPAGRDWYRVGLHRQRHTGLPTAPAVLVHTVPTELPYGLSPRELDVLTRTALGQSNQTIALGLYLSPRTVHSHIEHILRKIGAQTRAAAAARAIQECLVRPMPGQPGLERFLEAGPHPATARG
ncbi:MAG TPA: LuxR C-terminal-related transcriptional regulator [Rugosimonospora sp.]|nr:LuxR C-terminal-related transcriptional regulator [Rugosimonospora sp.]